MPGVEAEAARARAEMLRRLVDAVEQPNAAAGLRVTATLGGAMFRAGDDAEALLQRADQALYAAKRAGRQRVDWAE
jgi:GGDEF domain-containing protein